MPGGRYELVSSARSMKWWEWILAVVLTIIPLIGGFVGATSFNTGSYKKGWFLKPDWSPSPKVFSPVWSVLYLVMGLCSFLIWKIGGGFNRDTIPPLILYTLQLLLNWTWTPLFFGYGYFAVAEMVLAAIWGLVVACVLTYFPVSKVASILMVPYLVWLSFAAALNNSIVTLNGAVLNHTTSANATL